MVGSLHFAELTVQTSSDRPHRDTVTRVSVRLAVLAVVGVLLAPLTAHAGQITLAWNPSTSTVAGYAVYYGTSAGVYSGSVDVGNQTTAAVNSLTNGVRYYFVVKAYTTAGVYSSPSNEVNGVSGASSFTDSQLTLGVSVVRAVHVTELRTRINGLRAVRGLSAAAWTDATLASGSTASKAIHVTELRSALNAVYSALARTPPTYTDPSPVAGPTVIKAAHIAELRAAVLAVE